MAESQDVETLKRRGRRRLVGAIALVLVAVIVLPMIFDNEPRRPPPVSVRIPSEDDPAFKPKVVPKAPAPVPDAPPAPAADAKADAPPRPEQKPGTKSDAKPQPVPDAKPAPKPKAAAASPADLERRRAEAALAGAQLYIFQVEALATPEKVKDLTDKLAAVGVPHFTEPIATAKGTVTRVRAGPFQTRDAAEQALAKLKGMGFKPGSVTTR